MTERYLDFFEEHNCKVTFFVVADGARQYPHLIRKIAEKGHEIACHTFTHIPLDKLGVHKFKADLQESLKILSDVSSSEIKGFRAPIFSITSQTAWAYDILGELGFVYSSSVLPARNPLYGWPEFGREIKKMSGDVWELPVSVYSSRLLSFPFAGGIYFRLLPFIISRQFIKKSWKKNLPVLGYMHPYDIDEAQERFMHPGINNSRFYNRLMYMNRKTVLDKLKKTVALNARIIPYIDYVREYCS